MLLKYSATLIITHSSAEKAGWDERNNVTQAILHDNWTTKRGHAWVIAGNLTKRVKLFQNLIYTVLQVHCHADKKMWAG